MNFRKKTIGVKFPFTESQEGDYLGLTKTASEEIKSNFVHLLMTTKGERYFLPQFGTNLRQYLFDPQGVEVDDEIRKEIYDATEEFMPNIKINGINVTHYDEKDKALHNKNYQITIKIDYRIISGNFDFTDNVTINI